MSDEDLPERIRMNADAVRIALGPDATARIARAIAPTLARFAREKLVMPMEVEPSTFVVMQRRESST
jgi:hypothetical protein